MKRQPSRSRNADGLVDFRWSVAVDGHRVIEVRTRDLFAINRDALHLPRGQRFARESDYQDAEELDLRERLIVEVPDLEGRTRYERQRKVPPGTAYLDFASVDVDDEPSVLGFAARHGLLGRDVRFRIPGTRRPASGEALSTWRDEIRALSEVLRVYRLADVSDGVVPLWQSDAGWRSVQKSVNLRIGEHVGPAARLLWDRPSERLVLRLVPRTLLGAMWLQVARAIDAGTQYVGCAACHRFVALHPDRLLGRRSDARYCSSACKQRAWRARSGG